jgi:hypothetical protein
VAADADEPDAPLSNESPGETLGRAQQFGDLGDGEQPFDLGDRWAGHQAALPVAESSATEASRDRRLASARACSQWSRSATARRSRLPGGR